MEYKICVRVFLNAHVIDYSIFVLCKQKGDSKWCEIEKDIENYEYRSLSPEERNEYNNLNSLRYVTKDEIYDAKIELWNLLKPKI